MRIVRWFFGLLILAALAFGVAYYYAGTLDGPAITINQPSVIGQGGTLDVTVDAPGRRAHRPQYSARTKGPNVCHPRSRIRSCRCRRHGRRSNPHDTAHRQEDSAGAEGRSGDIERQRIAARVAAAEAGLVGGVARHSGAPDASESVGRLDASLRQSGRRGNGRVSSVAARRGIGRACRRGHLSGLSGYSRGA